LKQNIESQPGEERKKSDDELKRGGGIFLGAGRGLKNSPHFSLWFEAEKFAE
jgi:hypothetical protein